jgi:hypothetical protein
MAEYAIAHKFSAILANIFSLNSDLEALRKARKALAIGQRARLMIVSRESMQEAHQE